MLRSRTFYGDFAWIVFASILFIIYLTSCLPSAVPSTPSQTPKPLYTIGLPPESLFPSLTPPSATRTPIPPSATPQAAIETAEDDSHEPLAPILVIRLMFVDAQHGWVLGSSPLGELWENPIWEYSMASSDDGGITWQAIPMPVKLSSEPETMGDIFFADTQNGWFFYYTDSAFINGLYSTQDGGQTWREETPTGSIYRMARAVDGTVWAFELDDCECKWRFLVVSDASYESWREVKLNVPEVILWPDEIVIVDEMNILAPKWDLVSDEVTEVYHYSILSTSDGGTNWTELSTPCGGYIPSTSFYAYHVAIDKGQIWLGCGRAAGAGSGSKYVYYSSDGGQSWELRGKAGPPFDEEDTLYGSGYFSDFNALSSTFVYMTWQRSLDVILTQDGGMNWEYPEPPCSSETLRAHFIDPQHGWAFTRTWNYAGTCINSTIDGGVTWQCVLLPENEPCPPY